MTLPSKILLMSLLICGSGNNAPAQINSPTHFKNDKSFSIAVTNIIKKAGLDSVFDAGEDGPEHISFAVIDLSGKHPIFAGYHADNFIYPASVYKMYVAMEVLKQVNIGRHSLYENYVIPTHNVVDRSKEIAWDPRPLLNAGDSVTVHYLLDLMITRSDNTAANCLIDIAGRPSINKTMHENNWFGSEVTRKFLKRSVEDPGYDTIRSTETNAMHAAEFMYKIQCNTLVNPWVSMQMKTLLGNQMDTTKLSTGLPAGAMFFHKSGWWGPYSNDVGIVDDGGVKYVIAVFLPLQEETAKAIMKKISADIYALVRKRHFNP